MDAAWCRRATALACVLALALVGALSPSSAMQVMPDNGHITVPIRSEADNRTPLPPACQFFKAYEFEHRPLAPMLSDKACEGPLQGTPQQMKVIHVSPEHIDITWSTSSGRVYQGPVSPLSTDGKDSGTCQEATASKHESQATELGELLLYKGGREVAIVATLGKPYHQAYDGSWAVYNYTSGHIHRASLTGLEPGTDYEYRIPPLPVSYTFRTLPAVGSLSPLRIGFMADGGATWNSTYNLRLQQLLQPHLFVHVGDACYADEHWTHGRIDYSDFKRRDVAEAKNVYSNMTDWPATRWGTYQPVWDVWGRLIEPLTSSTPSLFAVGNHDIERQSDGRTLVSHTSRMGPGRQQSPHFHSARAGLAHFIFLSSYTDFSQGGQQFQWLQRELRTVDRSQTPWLIVSMHAPWYNSFTSHFLENECMRLNFEELLYNAGVDLLFTGHVHAYERTYPVYNFTVDGNGPVHFTIGNGGTLEGVSEKVVSWDGHCPAKYHGQEWYQPETCLDSSPAFQGGLHNHCPTGQPEWSAHRGSFVGSGLLEIFNSTHAEWKMFDTMEFPRYTVHDRAILVRGERADKSCSPAPVEHSTTDEAAPLASHSSLLLGAQADAMVGSRSRTESKGSLLDLDGVHEQMPVAMS
mmetsp:Transcript_21817/g.60611  ORF Transcript_21817/g.60611 Transcript_21817/m.60611 type:complete len:636 (+) Transcript_21817:331-2238(+)